MANDRTAAEIPTEETELSLPSTLASVETVEQIAEAMALRAGFDEDTASNIAMVTHEAAVNAVKHGNKLEEEKQFTVVLQRTADTLRIRIADCGDGFNPAELPDPLDATNLLRSSGRGVFLMRAMMDEVHFRALQPGTEVTLIKTVEPTSAG